MDELSDVSSSYKSNHVSVTINLMSKLKLSYSINSQCGVRFENLLVTINRINKILNSLRCIKSDDKNDILLTVKYIYLNVKDNKK